MWYCGRNGGRYIFLVAIENMGRPGYKLALSPGPPMGTRIIVR